MRIIDAGVMETCEIIVVTMSRSEFDSRGKGDGHDLTWLRCVFPRPRVWLPLERIRLSCRLAAAWWRPGCSVASVLPIVWVVNYCWAEHSCLWPSWRCWTLEVNSKQSTKYRQHLWGFWTLQLGWYIRWFKKHFISHNWTYYCVSWPVKEKNSWKSINIKEGYLGEVTKRLSNREKNR